MLINGKGCRDQRQNVVEKSVLKVAVMRRDAPRSSAAAKLSCPLAHECNRFPTFRGYTVTTFNLHYP